MPSLVIIEHDGQDLKPGSLHTITAAQQCDSDVHVLIAGHQCDAVTQVCQRIAGVSKVIVADNDCYAHPLAEAIAPLIRELSQNYSHILAPASTFGKNIMPRVAALLDVGQLSDITAVVDANTVVRPIYAGNAIATVQSSDSIKVITVRATGFDAATVADNNATVEAIDFHVASDKIKFVKQELTQSDRPELTAARVIVSGGRALQSSENFKLIEDLADQLNAAIGASRAAVDAGYVPNDYQVGQTGKIVAPELYIAIGISGAIQHLAGMKDSKVIVAINKDEDAPIFTIATYGLVGDLFTIVPELIEALKSE